MEIKVSTRDSHYAWLAAQPINWRIKATGCINYAANGFYIVKKTDRWRIIYEGSVEPSCSLHVPADLTLCQKR